MTIAIAVAELSVLEGTVVAVANTEAGAAAFDNEAGEYTLVILIDVAIIGTPARFGNSF